jgi:hypothetical protein
VRPCAPAQRTEAVWELADHRYAFIEVRPEHAGRAMHTLFVGDFDARISQIAERGLEPPERGTYANGVRKATFRDPDGNEIGFGGGLTETDDFSVRVSILRSARSTLGYD